MSRARVILGKTGEDLASDELERRGYVILARRYRKRGGEIDIIARDGETIVFVEVKTRAADSLSAPERAINTEKMIALRRAARDYVRRSGAEESQVRFDAISITGRELEHLRDAF